MNSGCKITVTFSFLHEKKGLYKREYRNTKSQDSVNQKLGFITKGTFV
jgi:hypothetical protein